jgi:outer membrane protein assembly factor BamB
MQADEEDEVKVSRRVVVLLVTLAFVAVGLSACLPPPEGSPASFSTEPPLIPAFAPGIPNYVVRCDPSAPVAVHVSSPTSTLVSVDGKGARGGIYGEYVDQQPGERFTVVVNAPGQGEQRYNVRCLPTDFPQWSAQPSIYGVTPFFMTAPLSAAFLTRTAIYDRYGVPLWWSDKQVTVFSTLLPNGNVAAMIDGGVEERTLDGTLVRFLSTVGGPADPHDVLLLPNGHFVMVTIQPRTGVDLTPIGGPADASVCDHVIEEIDPSDGSLVWSWDTYDHIPPTEMDPQWFGPVIAGGPNDQCGYDVYHWNAIEPTGTGYILSYRHLDAVYDVDQASGDVVWKLGGSARPESLTVVGDPVFTGGSHFGGQHDSRLLPDGTVTLFDDGTSLGRAPRAVRYSIDTGAHTATLLNSARDPNIASSFCCGSARYQGSDVWVVGWGGNEIASETVGDLRQFTLQFPGGNIYRLLPLSSSEVSRAQLDAAMDAKFATPSAASEPPPDAVISPYPP